MSFVETSVIIPFKDSERTFERCLQSLLAQSYKNFEVVLVDNNSRDSSKTIAQKFKSSFGHDLKIEIISEGKPGAAAARNKGARIARGNYLAFTDSDCVADPHWLADVVRSFDEGKIGAVAGNIRGYQPVGVVELFHALFTLRGLETEQAFSSFRLNIGGFPTSNLVVRRAVFEAVGGFDELIPIYGEDYDLCARVYRAGFKIKSVPKGGIYHIHRRDLKSTWTQSFSFGKSHSLLLAKHFQRYLLIEAGKLTIRSESFPMKVWLNLSSADKKAAILMTIGLFSWQLSLLLWLYLAYVFRHVWVRSRKENLPISAFDCAMIVGLLIYKSAAMTTGRLLGSIENRVLCL